jgi:hypothetical protein
MSLRTHYTIMAVLTAATFWAIWLMARRVAEQAMVDQLVLLVGGAG